MIGSTVCTAVELTLTIPAVLHRLFLILSGSIDSIRFDLSSVDLSNYESDFQRILLNIR